MQVQEHAHPCVLVVLRKKGDGAGNEVMLSAVGVLIAAAANVNADVQRITLT